MTDIDHKGYYKILNVTKNTDKKSIKKSYHKLAFKYHPDRNHSSTAATKFSQITEAYDVLMDDNLRREYDRENEVIAIEQENLKRQQEYQQANQQYTNQRNNQYAQQDEVRYEYQYAEDYDNNYRQEPFHNQDSNTDYNKKNNKVDNSNSGDSILSNHFVQIFIIEWIVFFIWEILNGSLNILGLTFFTMIFASITYVIYWIVSEFGKKLNFDIESWAVYCGCCMGPLLLAFILSF